MNKFQACIFVVWLLACFAEERRTRSYAVPLSEFSGENPAISSGIDSVPKMIKFSRLDAFRILNYNIEGFEPENDDFQTKIENSEYLNRKKRQSSGFGTPVDITDYIKVTNLKGVGNKPSDNKILTELKRLNDIPPDLSKVLKVTTRKEKEHFVKVSVIPPNFQYKGQVVVNYSSR